MSSAPIERVRASAYTIPTESTESDGTHVWNRTTLITVAASAGGKTGLGYTYSHAAAAQVVTDLLGPAVIGNDALDVRSSWRQMNRALRNVMRPGIGTAALGAVDTALWDLKGRLLDQPVVVLLDAARDEVPVYASGGFTSQSIAELRDQLGGWVAGGFTGVKIKIGREPGRDVERVAAAREAIGETPELMVDANGAYGLKQALKMAEAFADHGVTWFEEPVSSDDLVGLRLIREGAPAGMDVTAGEYGFDAFYFRRMLEANAVDVLQPDATRCGGITGFLDIAALCDAFGREVSAHAAPTLHAHAGCAVNRLRHVESFHDQVRIEQMLFDGAPLPEGGRLRPDRSRPGLGIELRENEARPFLVH